MALSHITPVEPPYCNELQNAFDVVMPPGVPPLNIFRTVARNPRVLSRMVIARAVRGQDRVTWSRSSSRGGGAVPGITAPANGFDDHAVDRGRAGAAEGQ